MTTVPRGSVVPFDAVTPRRAAVVGSNALPTTGTDASEVAPLGLMALLGGVAISVLGRRRRSV